MHNPSFSKQWENDQPTLGIQMFFICVRNKYLLLNPWGLSPDFRTLYSKQHNAYEGV